MAFKIRQNPFSAGALPRTPLGELTTLPQTLSQLERGHPSPYPTARHASPRSPARSTPMGVGLYAYLAFSECIWIMDLWNRPHTFSTLAPKSVDSFFSNTSLTTNHYRPNSMSGMHGIQLWLGAVDVQSRGGSRRHGRWRGLGWKEEVRGETPKASREVVSSPVMGSN